MKIAWFTPFNKKSAIGRYSQYATQVLSKYANVDIFISNKENLHDTSLSTVHYTSKNVLSLLKDYDICIYNIGDYTEYHASIYETMCNCPGIVIVHDLCLHNFFWGYYNLYLHKPEEYINILISLYGKKNAYMILDASRAFETWSALNLLDYHMTDLLCPYSLGFVAHSKYHESKLKSIYDGPICIVPLLYKNDWDIDNKDKDFDGYDSSKINLLTVGNINSNKRIHSTISAIGSNQKLRQKINLTCIGSLENKEYVEKLNRQITEMNLTENIRLLGFVENEQLSNYYTFADASVNLRYPAFEGASASLVEQMQLGKTVIVSDTGVYSEIPNDCVIKIDPKNEVEELRQVLLNLINNPSKRKSYGANAKAYVKETFSPDKYGEKLYNFIKSIIFLKPLYSITDLISQELNSMGVSLDMRICETVSKEVELLYEK